MAERHYSFLEHEEMTNETKQRIYYCVHDGAYQYITVHFLAPLSTPFLMSRMIHRSMKAYSISPNAASFVVKEMVDTYRMHLLPCASGQ